MQDWIVPIPLLILYGLAAAAYVVVWLISSEVEYRASQRKRREIHDRALKAAIAHARKYGSLMPKR